MGKADAADKGDVRADVEKLKRERILAAAVDLFNRYGFSQTSLEAVASQMGVTKPFIYARFGSKTELLGEICSRAMQMSLEAIDDAIESGSSPKEQLEFFARGLMQAVLNSGRHLAIYMREEKNLSDEDYELIRSLRYEVDEKLIGILNRGIGAGDFEVPDPKMAALAIGGIATWIGMRLRADSRKSPEQLANNIVPLIMAMAGGGRIKSSDYVGKD